MRRVLKNTIILLPAAILAACASPTSPDQSCSSRSRAGCQTSASGDYINPLADYINPLADYINPLARGDSTNNGEGNGGSN